MKLIKQILMLTFLVVPGFSQAAMVWSACQTVTAVSDFIAYNNAVWLALSPGITGCGSTSIGGVGFVIGVDGVTTTNIGGFLSVSIAAYTTGHQVTVFYDNSSTQCATQIIAVGGYTAQCP